MEEGPGIGVFLKDMIALTGVAQGTTRNEISRKKRRTPGSAPSADNDLASRFAHPAQWATRDLDSIQVDLAGWKVGGLRPGG